MRNYFPKRTSGAPLHTLSKFYDVPGGFVSSRFWDSVCHIWGGEVPKNLLNSNLVSKLESTASEWIVLSFDTHIIQDYPIYSQKEIENWVICPIDPW